jgi:hypothetical protein
MKITGHKTEAICRRYAIVAERDITEGLARVAVFQTAASGGRWGTNEGTRWLRWRPASHAAGPRKSLLVLVPEVGIEPTRSVSPSGF